MPLSPAEVMVITGYDHGMTEVGRLARASWGAYAARHHYSFMCPEIDGVAGTRHPSWAKLRLLWALVKQGAFSMWVDADSAVVNPDITIEEILRTHSQDILVGGDPNGVCCAHLIVRPTEWASRFLDAWFFMGDSDQWARWHVSPKWEQDALKGLLELFPGVRDKIGRLDPGLIAQVGEPKPGQWIVHASGGQTTHQLQRLGKYGWETK